MEEAREPPLSPPQFSELLPPNAQSPHRKHENQAYFSEAEEVVYFGQKENKDGTGHTTQKSSEEATVRTSTVNSQLLYAVRMGNMVDVRKLLQEGVDIHFKGATGRTALHIAINGGSIDIIEELLKLESIDVNHQDSEGKSALHYVIRCGKDTGDYPGTFTYIPIRMREKWAHLTSLLIEKGANLNCRDNDGHTPFHEAVYTGNLHATNLLLDRGADTNTQDSNGRTPLHDAAFKGRSCFTELLLRRGADVNFQDKNGRTPLHNAASSGNLDSTKLLLESGADTNIQDSNGYTPLHHAASNHRGGSSRAELLLGGGADVNCRDSKGCTPLHFAASRGNFSTIKVLLDNEAEIACEDNNGCTPLHYIARCLRYYARNRKQVGTKSSIEECLQTINEAGGTLLPRYSAFAAVPKILEIVKNLQELMQQILPSLQKHQEAVVGVTGSP